MIFVTYQIDFALEPGIHNLMIFWTFWMHQEGSFFIMPLPNFSTGLLKGLNPKKTDFSPTKKIFEQLWNHLQLKVVHLKAWSGDTSDKAM